MSLQQAISEYVARKASFESSQARATEIQSVLLPDAEQGISTARGAKSQAETALRSAGTVAEVQSARASLIQAEQEFNDRVQLRDNLDSELKLLNSTNVWRQLSCPVRDNYDGRLGGLTFYSFQPA